MKAKWQLQKIFKRKEIKTKDDQHMQLGKKLLLSEYTKLLLNDIFLISFSINPCEVDQHANIKVLRLCNGFVEPLLKHGITCILQTYNFHL